MAVKRYSRLAKTESKKARRSALFYTLATVAFIVIMFVFGVPAISAFLNIVTDFSGNSPIVTNTDTTPPPPPRFDTLPDATNQRKLKVTGSAQDGASVEITFNNGKKELIVNSSGEFTTTYDLRDGENTISAVAKGTNGVESVATRQYTITYDDTPPDFTLIKPSDGESFFGSAQEYLSIEGQTEEDAQVTVNDRYAIVDNVGKFTFGTRLQEGENTFAIIARDNAGNETKIEFKISFSK